MNRKKSKNKKKHTKNKLDITDSKQNDILKFEIIADENDVRFHTAYIMCCKTFPNMMSYCFFKEYVVSVALLDDKVVGFMLLELLNLPNVDDKNISQFVDQKNIKVDSVDDFSNVDDNFSDVDDLASKSTNSDIFLDNTQEKKITLASIGIDTNMRGKKIGDKYIKWLLESFPNTNVELHVSVNNVVAINLYIKNGFKISHTEKLYYNEQGYEPYTGTGRDAHIMVYN